MTYRKGAVIKSLVAVLVVCASLRADRRGAISSTTAQNLDAGELVAYFVSIGLTEKFLISTAGLSVGMTAP